jgi:TRAP-type transport system periplasmic protein
MKKWMWVFVGFVALALLPGMGWGAPIVIKAITAFPKNHLNNDPVQMFIDEVNRQAKGKVEIRWLGGPEVTAAFDQGNALKKGTIDMLLYYPFGYLKPLMPEAEAKGLSELAEWEERKTGAFELWTEIFAKRVNAKYIGRLHNLVPFMVYTNKKIEKIDDFKGAKIRVMPLYVPFMKALGAVPVMIPPTDLHTAMERGVVDGFMWPKVGVISWGLQEVTKYIIEPGVFQMEPATVINLDTWKKIPADAQTTIMDVMKVMEYAGTMRNAMITEKEDEIRYKAGMRYIQMAPAEGEKFRKICYDNTWDYVIQSAPEYGPKLRKATLKSAIPKGTFPWQ